MKSLKKQIWENLRDWSSYYQVEGKCNVQVRDQIWIETWRKVGIVIGRPIKSQIYWHFVNYILCQHGW